MSEPNIRTAWVMGDAHLFLYCADKTTGDVSANDWQGNVLPVLASAPFYYSPENPSNIQPLISDCYLQSGVSLSARATFRRRAVTGRGGRRLVPMSYNFDDCQLDINSLLIDKSFEYDLNKYFNVNQTLLFVIKFINPSYSNMAPNTNDYFTLRFAHTTQFKITGDDVSTIQATASFEGELLV